VAGWLLAVTLLPLLTVVLVPLRDDLSLSTILMLYLAAVVLIAAIGGLVVGLVAAVAAFLLENWYFTPPIHTWTIAQGENLVALVVFVTVSTLVSVLVGQALRRSREAQRARAEAHALARTTGAMIGQPDPMRPVVEQLRSSFGLDGVSVLERTRDGWVTLADSGPGAATSPGTGMDVPLDAGGSRCLVLTGGHIGALDQEVLRAFADQLRLALESRELRQEALEAETLAETAALRRALLQGVSHDLRTPLASIKAAVTSLQQKDVHWSAADQEELLGTIDAATDRLDRLVANLLDMSRLQSGALSLRCGAVALEDVVASALTGLSIDGHRTEVDVPETVPLVEADAGLLERAVANLVSNALAWSPADKPVRIEAAAVGDRVCLRVIDRGPGIPPAQREHIFEPFSRVGDRSADAGVGLGLAVAHGFVTAMRGDIGVDDTPGGGLTVTIVLAPAMNGQVDGAPL
jgi:two-component system sensor histidine kinase KdpD